MLHIVVYNEYCIMYSVAYYVYQMHAQLLTDGEFKLPVQRRAGSGWH